MKLSEIKAGEIYSLHRAAGLPRAGKMITTVRVLEKVGASDASGSSRRVRVQYLNDIEETTKLVSHRHLQNLTLA